MTSARVSWEAVAVDVSRLKRDSHSASRPAHKTLNHSSTALRSVSKIAWISAERVALSASNIKAQAQLISSCEAMVEGVEPYDHGYVGV
jgi:hypothetical protein